jgi:hypothetical protein
MNYQKKTTLIKEKLFTVKAEENPIPVAGMSLGNSGNAL